MTILTRNLKKIWNQGDFKNLNFPMLQWIRNNLVARSRLIFRKKQFSNIFSLELGKGEKSSQYSMGLSSHWYQTGNNTCYIPKVSKFYVEEEYLFQQVCIYDLWDINVYFIDQKIMQTGHPMELNFKGLEMQLCIFSWWQQKIRHNLSKMFQCGFIFKSCHLGNASSEYNNP